MHFIKKDDLNINPAAIKEGFSDVAKAFDMTWELHDTREPMRVMFLDGQQVLTPDRPALPLPQGRDGHDHHRDCLQSPGPAADGRARKASALSTCR